MNTLKSALEGVEKERDYYFSKLREVELLCQEQGEENAPFVDRLMEVLYASDEQVSEFLQTDQKNIQMLLGKNWAFVRDHMSLNLDSE